MFFEAETWVAVAFFIFAAILWKVGGLRAMTEALDQRGKRIRAELDEAKRLREEAAKVLADYQRAAARPSARRRTSSPPRRTRPGAPPTRRTAACRISSSAAPAPPRRRSPRPRRRRRRRSAPRPPTPAIAVSETLLREKLAGDAAQDLVAKSLADVRRKLNA